MKPISSNPKRWRLCIAFCLGCSAVLPVASAHEIGTSHFDLDIGEQAVEARLHIDLLTFLRLVPTLDSNGDRQISKQEAEAAAEDVVAYLNERVSFDIDGREVADWGEAQAIVWPDEEGQPVSQSDYHRLLVQFPFRRKVAQRPADVRVTFDVFVEFGGRHRILGNIGCAESTRQSIVFNHLEPDYLFDVDHALNKQATTSIERAQAATAAQR